MKFGVLKDIKQGEYRVIATPAEVSMIAGDGHEVYVQKGAGAGAGFTDEAYAAEGAKLVDTMEEIYAACDFVAKVKEIEPSEYGLLRENQIIFTCIHPAAHPEEVQALLDSKCIAFTVMDINIGTLRDIGKQFNEEVNTMISNRYNIAKLLPEMDVVYNCVKLRPRWIGLARIFLIRCWLRPSSSAWFPCSGFW